MASKEAVKELFNDLFEQQALILGGIVAMHEVEDGIVWDVMRNLSVLRMKAMKSIDREYGDPDQRKGHPAIEEFLKEIRGAPIR